MRITKISSIREHGIYRDFRWEQGLPPFGRYNLVYGWNGSGKSTLSRLFLTAGQRRQPSPGEMTIQVDGLSIRGSDFSSVEADTQLPSIRVFNKDFIDEAVFNSRGSIGPIFYLGKESVEAQAAIEAKKLQIETVLKPAFENSTKQLKAYEDAIEAYRIAQGDKIRELLRAPEKTAYTNYNKSDYKREVELLIQAGREVVGASLKSDEQIAALVVQKGVTTKPELPSLAASFADVEQLSREVEELLGRSVVRVAVAALQKDRDLERWVEQGMSLHGILRGLGEHSPDCKFCAQPLPEQRVKDLEQHFNDAYAQLQNDLSGMQSRLASAAAAFDPDKLPPSVALLDHHRPYYERASALLVEAWEPYRPYLDRLQLALVEKESNLSQSLPLPKFTRTDENGEAIPLAVPDKKAAEDALCQVNRAIDSHNRDRLGLVKLVGDARLELEKAYIAASFDEYAEKLASVLKEGLVKADLGNQLSALKEEIKDLELQVISHREPADELNKELKSYLGRDELRFAMEGSGYAIFRGEERAARLSEGEKTAIAFLYFLKSLNGSEFKLTDGVVVIDDPVASLDANSLFCALAFMQKRTVDCAQLFILTHNFAFFRQVKQWMGYLNRDDREAKRPPEEHCAQFYMIDCYDVGGKRAARLRRLDPLLRNHDSEYHYLFAKVWKGHERRGDVGLEDYYGLPNISRRLLESFLGFRHPHIQGFSNLLNQVTFEDPAEKAKVKYFLDHYSHEEGPGEDHDLTLLAETPAVLRSVLKIIEGEDEQHYERMKRLVKRNG